MGRMKELFMEDYERTHLIESIYIDDEYQYDEYLRTRRVSGYERVRTRLSNNINGKANWISKIKHRSTKKSLR